jgi:hypothetical protein
VNSSLPTPIVQFPLISFFFVVPRSSSHETRIHSIKWNSQFFKPRQVALSESGTLHYLLHILGLGAQTGDSALPTPQTGTHHYLSLVF